MFGARRDPAAVESLSGRVLGLEDQQRHADPRLGSLAHRIAALDMHMHEIEARLVRLRQRWQLLYVDDGAPEPELAPSQQALSIPPVVARYEEMQAAQLPVLAAPPESLTAEQAEGAPLVT